MVPEEAVQLVPVCTISWCPDLGAQSQREDVDGHILHRYNPGQAQTTWTQAGVSAVEVWTVMQTDSTAGRAAPPATAAGKAAPGSSARRAVGATAR